jgi:NADH:ubiquinone oxidoreductase subunit 6 (subunit J)
LNAKRLVWNLMYVGAVICALICVTMVYEITTTQNTANEWIVWTCVIIGFLLFATGFLYESKNKEEAPAEDTLKGKA